MKIFIVLLLPLFSSFLSSTRAGIPGVCICKWKNGKRWVECRSRNLKILPTDIDVETQVLDLTDNQFTNLSRKVFSRVGLVHLQRLHLSQCQIESIHFTAFQGLSNLVELNLANNLLTFIPSNAFSYIPYLRELDLSNNSFNKVVENAFENIPQLISLDLHECSVRDIDANAFCKMNQLKKLHLQNNYIQEIKPKIIESISGLHEIELSGNPWICDCKLRALKRWLVLENVPHSIEPICHEPVRLKNKGFGNLNLNEFACRPTLVNEGEKHIEAHLGGNASLTCAVKSIPNAKLKWFFKGRELFNNSLLKGANTNVNLRERTFENRKESILTLSHVKEDNNGVFLCVASNKGGSVEENFTLQIGYFVNGVASLESGKIAGIALSASIICLIMGLCLLSFLFKSSLNGCKGFWRPSSKSESSLETPVAPSSFSDSNIIQINGVCYRGPEPLSDYNGHREQECWIEWKNSCNSKYFQVPGSLEPGELYENGFASASSSSPLDRDDLSTNV